MPKSKTQFQNVEWSCKSPVPTMIVESLDWDGEDSSIGTYTAHYTRTPYIHHTLHTALFSVVTCPSQALCSWNGWCLSLGPLCQCGRERPWYLPGVQWRKAGRQRGSYGGAEGSWCLGLPPPLWAWSALDLHG